jgi:Tol biopolymer transport system component
VGTVTVAWADSTTVYWWNDARAEVRQTFNGEAVDIAIAPDGQSIALLEIVGGLPNRLWQADFIGISPLVTSENDLDGASIAQFAWEDGQTLYFNTVRFDSAVGGTPQNDLWRMDLRNTDGPEQLLPPGAGGAFTLSPDRATIAITQPGTLTPQGTPDAEGAVLLYDVDSGETEIKLGFLAVATGSPMPYFPRVAWTPDSSAFYVAVPPSDIIYGGEGDTLLWQIPRDGAAEQVGAVPASFFRPVQWSGDRSQVFYAVDTLNPNSFDLFLADADGGNPVTLGSGPFAFVWADAGDRFLWAFGDPVPGYYIGDADDPRRYTFDAPAFSPTWADDTRLAFVTRDNNDLNLNLGTLNTDGTALAVTALSPLVEPPVALDAVATDGE